VLDLPGDAEAVADACWSAAFSAGCRWATLLSRDLERALLVCATEKRTEADIEAYGQALEEVLQA
jgi:hypothetical protein